MCENSKKDKASEKLQERINNLEKENQKLKDNNQKLKDKNQELMKENRDMIIKLAFYESSNMSSSVPTLEKEKKMLKKSKEGKNSVKTKKSGPCGVKGHKGNTKVLGEPDVIIENNIYTCPHCDSNAVKKYDKTMGKKVEDTQVIKKTRVIKFVLRKCKCLDCGNIFYSRHTDCPVKGNIGINIMGQVIVNRFLGRGSLGICKLIADTFTQFKMSRETVNNIINRVVPALEEEYEKIVKKTRNEFVRYADETGHNLNGSKVWLWVCVVSDAVLYLFGDRGKNTAKKLLGTTDEIKILARDGWRAYNNLGFLTQRCWDHLRRYSEVKPKNRNDNDLVCFENTINQFYKDIQDYKKNPPKDKKRRLIKYNQYIARFHKIVKKFDGIKSVQKALTYFFNGGSDWFTCVLFPEVKMSNNTAELYIRDPVLDRKIFYCFRSETNMNNYAKIKSVVMTWKKNGDNVYEKLIGVLKNHNAKGIA